MEFRPFQELLPRHVEITRMIDEEVILERHGDFFLLLCFHIFHVLSS
jgi:hypothetical protein